MSTTGDGSCYFAAKYWAFDYWAPRYWFLCAVAPATVAKAAIWLRRRRRQPEIRL